MRRTKVLVVILCSAGIATLGLLHGGGELPEANAGHPLDDHFDPLMPRYPHAAEFPLGDSMRLGATDVQMSYFATTDPPMRVARYYRAMWEQEGLSVHEHVTPAGGVVGTFDPRVNAARSVSLFVSKGRTYAFPSVLDRPQGAAQAGDLGAREGLPVHPGSTSGMTLRTSDQGVRNLVTTYSNGATLADNLSFYRNEMSGRGWSEVRVPDFEELEGHRALVFERHSGRCTINFTPIESDRVVVCVILEGRR